MSCVSGCNRGSEEGREETAVASNKPLKCGQLLRLGFNNPK